MYLHLTADSPTPRKHVQPEPQREMPTLRKCRANTRDPETVTALFWPASSCNPTHHYRLSITLDREALQAMLDELNRQHTPPTT